MSSILLPSTKSICQRTLDLFASAGIRLNSQGGDSDILLNGVRWPYCASLVHQSRIAQLVAAKNEYVLGVLGLDGVRESGQNVEVCADLLYNRTTWNKAKIVVVAGKNGITSVDSIPNGAEVLTEYPRLTAEYFKKRGRKVVIVPSRGSIESEVPQPYPFGVCLSETGASIRNNGLRIIGEIMETSTVLIANKKEFKDPETRRSIKAFATILLGAIAAREKVMLTANVPATNLSEVLAALPALRSPTVTTLADKRYLSVGVVVPRDNLNYLQEQLLALECEGLIVTPLISVIQSRE